MQRSATDATPLLTTTWAKEKALFNAALDHFKEVNSLDGSIPGEESIGLGPAFNGNSCAMCHVEPDIGGSSPGMLTRVNQPAPNPQVALAILHQATNIVPPFITFDGPIREARFVRNRDGSLDGGFHGLFTIAGRTDAHGCMLEQPNFALQLAINNVIFRIPTPLFGLGLVEATPETLPCRKICRPSKQLKPHWVFAQLQYQWQRRYDHPLWLEGAKQVAAHLCRRSL